VKSLLHNATLRRGGKGKKNSEKEHNFAMGKRREGKGGRRIKKQTPATRVLIYRREREKIVLKVRTHHKGGREKKGERRAEKRTPRSSSPTSPPHTSLMSAVGGKRRKKENIFKKSNENDKVEKERVAKRGGYFFLLRSCPSLIASRAAPPCATVQEKEGENQRGIDHADEKEEEER